MVLHGMSDVGRLQQSICSCCGGSHVMCSVGLGKMAVFLHAGETKLALACRHQRMQQQEGHINAQVVFCYTCSCAHNYAFCALS